MTPEEVHFPLDDIVERDAAFVYVVLPEDDDGYVTIVDRKKELIINAAGKNMSPTNIENTLKAACPVLVTVVVIGDRRPSNVALMVLDEDVSAAIAHRHHIADTRPAGLAAHPLSPNSSRQTLKPPTPNCRESNKSSAFESCLTPGNPAATNSPPP